MSDEHVVLPVPRAVSNATLAKLDALPEPPTLFTPDPTASLVSRAEAILGAKVKRMEDALAAGEDVSMVDIARLVDQVTGKTAVREDDEEYDLGRLDADELEALTALLDKARRA